MKNLIIAITFLTSTAAFAISDSALISRCAEVGEVKIELQAATLKCAVVENSIVAVDVDNRFYNPSKYVWYKGKATCTDSVIDIDKLVQYNSLSKKCL